MENKLPNKWIAIDLKDGVYFQEGPGLRKFQYREEGIPFLNIRTIIDGKVEKSLCKFLDEDEVETKYLHFLLLENDIICSTSGTIGKTALINKNDLPLMLNTSIIRFRSRNLNLINRNFIHYYLKSNWFFTQADEFSTGTAQKNLGPSHLNRFKFPLPPLAEQQRIVDKLDALFGHLDSLKTRLHHIPQIIKNFRQAVLTQAVTGKLTEEWRFGKELEEWEICKLNDLCLSITDGDHQAPPRADSGVPFLVISNVSKGYFDFKGVTRYVPRDYFESLKYTRVPKRGDVLYTVTGSYGISLFVNFDKEFCFQRHIAILKPDNSRLDSLYLNYSLSSSLLMNQAHNVATGTAQKTVPLRGIKSFELPLPPKKEQTEIVKRVDHLFAKADAIEVQYQNLKVKIDSMPQAILAKAFKGELVEQLDTDGSAEDLLEEIKRLKTEVNEKKVKGGRKK